MTAPHIPPDNHKVAVTCGRSLGGQGVGIEKFCESGRCEGQDTPPLGGGEVLPLTGSLQRSLSESGVPWDHPWVFSRFVGKPSLPGSGAVGPTRRQG